MAFTSLRESRAREDYANYEQQSPDRDLYYRQIDNPQQEYMQGTYSNQYVGQQYMGYGYQQPQYTGYFQQQANQFVNNGFNAPQYTMEQICAVEQEQYNRDMQFNQQYDRIAQANRVTQKRSGKKSINKDMIKIIVTIMVIALTICALLIANQFLSANQAQAADEVQNIDSELLASVAVEEGSYAMTSVTTIPDYEYEQSSNWFDRLCDKLSGKLK